jgi:hypothetical protein
MLTCGGAFCIDLQNAVPPAAKRLPLTMLFETTPDK